MQQHRIESTPSIMPSSRSIVAALLCLASLSHASIAPTTTTTTVAATSDVTPIVQSVIPSRTLNNRPFPDFSSPVTPADGVYSSMWCIGGRGRYGTHADRSCRFRNICYKPSTDEWQFRLDPASKDTFITLLDNGEIVSKMPQQLVNLRSMGIEKDARYWAPKVMPVDAGPAPRSAFVPRRRESEPHVAVLYHPHYPANIGHVIGDDLFPVFNLQASFGLLTSEVQLILQRDCDLIFQGMAKKIAQCREMLNMLTPGVTQRQWLAATQEDLMKRLQVPDQQGDLVCFENLLAGQGPWGFQQSLGKAPSWWAYHAHYLSNMGLQPHKTPSKPRITISIKKGKRGLYNNDELVAHIKKSFPDVEVDAIELRSLNGWRNELEYLSSTSVLITPCGGVSMSAMFLPHGASMIVVDYFSVQEGKSTQMEGKLFGNMHLRTLHYPFTMDEVVLDEKLFDRKKHQDVRDYGQVKVNVERMTLLVQAALEHNRQFMPISQSE